MVYVILHYTCNGVYVGHVQAAKEARYDKEAVVKFFRSVCILVLLYVLPLPILFLSLLFGMSSNFCVNPLFQLIRRRYFSDDLSAQTPWSISSVQRVSHRLDEDLSDEDQSYKNMRYSLPNTYNF